MALSNQDSASIAYLHRPKRAAAHIAWFVVGVVIIEFLLITYRKYGHLDAGSYSIFWSRREWLWTHLAGGTLTMLLGPVQFLTQFPRAYPRLHRWTGRCYLLAMLVACMGAAGLIATTPAGFAFRSAFGATALAWLVTALMGFIAIRRKLPQVHRRWMVRNCLVTLAPITFRAMIRIPGVMELAAPSVMIPTLLWLSWVVPLLAYEVAAGAINLAHRARSRRAQLGRPGCNGFDAESA